MKRYTFLAPCLLVAFALALAACGGGSSENGAIEDVIESSATTADPANCTKLQTQKFDEQNAQTEGAEAVEACEAEAQKGEGVAESVDISKVSVDGESATAEVAFSGGGFDGQTVEVSLTREGGAWKLDEVLGFAEYDAERFAEAFEAAAEGEPELSPDIASCIAEAFAQASQQEAEELAFSGGEGPIEDLVRSCK